MPQSLAEPLKEALAAYLPRLGQMNEEQAAARPGPDAWSRKEELGHLIDSAVNNHARFVRAALEPEYRGPSYDGEGWVRVHGYQDLAWTTLMGYWQQHNAVLAHLVGQISEEALATPCYIGDGAPVTLRFVIEDYVGHMKHHLDHIVG